MNRTRNKFQNIWPVLVLILCVVVWLVTPMIDETIFQLGEEGTASCWAVETPNLEGSYFNSTRCTLIRTANFLAYDMTLVSVCLTSIALAHQFLKKSRWIKIIGVVMILLIFPFFTGILYQIQYWIRNYGIWVFLAMTIFLVTISICRKNKGFVTCIWNYFTDPT